MQSLIHFCEKDNKIGTFVLNTFNVGDITNLSIVIFKPKQKWGVEISWNAQTDMILNEDLIVSKFTCRNDILCDFFFMHQYNFLHINIKYVQTFKKILPQRAHTLAVGPKTVQSLNCLRTYFIACGNYKKQTAHPNLMFILYVQV